MYETKVEKVAMACKGHDFWQSVHGYVGIECIRDRQQSNNLYNNCDSLRG